MFRIPSIAAAASAVAILAGCEGPLEIRRPPPTAGDGLFDRYVAIGNSLTAGYQSGGINDSTQRESYAYLLAHQAMGTDFAYPQLAGRGCAPPVVNFHSQERVGGLTVTDLTCDLRTASSVTRILNNVAVPGATSLDPFSTSTDASNALTTFILGGRSQVRAALEAHPTFVSVWIGNNDVLEAAVTGVLTAVPGVSRGLTSEADFGANVDRLLDDLTASPGLRGGILIGVVDVTSVPVLFPAQALGNPHFKAAFDALAGASTTLLPGCTPTSTSLISLRILGEIRRYVATGGAAGHPPVIACDRGLLPSSPLVGELFVLDHAELATVSQRVSQYNAILQARANAMGWAYYDPNPQLTELHGSGAIPLVPDLASATNTFGAYISLDGVHPRRAAHVLIANGIVAALNAHYGVALPTVQ